MITLKTYIELSERADADFIVTIWAQWQELDGVIHYNSKIYILQNTALCKAVISHFYNDIFAGHFSKSRTAELMQQSHD